MSMTPLDIQVLPPEANSDETLMTEITDLVNRVYASAEAGIWLPGTPRTTVEEIAKYTGKGQIVVARCDGRVVGSIHLAILDADTAETGMLVSHPEMRNQGIGRRIRQFVFDFLKSHGISSLQIELLTPRDLRVESKDFMASWNERDGYKIVGRGSLEDKYPHLAPLLAVPCDFILYKKELRQ
ncbi:GNAT superfamily N-acetyltransferase [Streptomyces sp. SAI-135]|nr:GNAT superfamily N-acetyltransferase [Streptomyces sp. SAI-090]MDH6554252.1 GNAT superfamily N-acetyltransferase [Streptomyces sp. SAI-041]MDH6573512.1 GNAT superfamily N-acetyltransferase [Streptomyces sp. SAI-117]MDH6613753.1 GNAT superfamily N-acetyltransferase [Streptomyces sp. SAI-135]